VRLKGEELDYKELTKIYQDFQEKSRSTDLKSGDTSH
jgi:hypothetical protein